MKKRILNFTTYRVVIILGVICAVLLGSGIALANYYQEKYLTNDDTWHYYYGSFDDDDILPYGYDVYYETYHSAKMSSDRTDVYIHGVGYQNGDSYPTDAKFGPLYIYDEDNNHNVYYDDFFSVYIDNLGYALATVNWFYGSMSSTNDAVLCDQYVGFGNPGYWTPLTHHYTFFYTD